jgi:hypothetical protein
VVEAEVVEAAEAEAEEDSNEEAINLDVAAGTMNETSIRSTVYP